MRQERKWFEKPLQSTIVVFPMLRNTSEQPVDPKRVVILGAQGFVGSASAAALAPHTDSLVALGHTDLNLLEADAAAKLVGHLDDQICLIVISARAPVRDNAMLVDNLRMIEQVCLAVSERPPAHVVYISSDAVYRDSSDPLTEQSCAEPSSLHGVMHLARELMLRNAFSGPTTILRPSLLYGAADPHNGYGPNQFRRLAAEGKPIRLFGEGEERRDHVYIDDVAELVRRVVLNRCDGILNVATGEVASFREIAEMVASHFDPPPAIETTPRKGPMPHNGYRPFDASACRAAFPDFHYTPLPDGIAQTHAKSARLAQ